MLSFKSALQKYQKDSIGELSESAEGRKFLLLRSLSRGEHLAVLASNAGLDASAVGKRDLFQFLYESSIPISTIKQTIRNIFADERRVRAAHEPKLVGELYKMREFNWGGLHQNSLEKTIVNNYVKKVTSYEQLNSHIENDLLDSMRGYVRCSWYNHWTSIIIEDIFKDNPAVLPAIGLVKKIDFFVRDIPFDLKVTYLPEGFVKDARKQEGKRPEITLLRQAARSRAIAPGAEMSESAALEHLWTVITDQPDREAKHLINDLQDFRLNLIDQVAEDPTELITWLYENQGERRFDAANRLFLVLVNEANFFESWQLKRNKAVLESAIDSYLASSSVGREIEFQWEGRTYSTLADVIVVRHRSAT